MSYKRTWGRQYRLEAEKTFENYSQDGPHHCSQQAPSRSQRIFTKTLHVIHSVDCSNIAVQLLISQACLPQLFTSKHVLLLSITAAYTRTSTHRQYSIRHPMHQLEVVQCQQALVSMPILEANCLLSAIIKARQALVKAISNHSKQVCSINQVL